MRKRTSVFPLLISYFFMYFNTYFINPYLALDSLVYSSPRYALLIAAFIFISPMFAQFTTLYGFSAIAEKKHREEWLIILGYSFGSIQWILLLVMMGLGITNPFITLTITVFCNLFLVAYIPAVKAYLTSLIKTEKKGKALGQLNMIESLAWFFGMLIGGIVYNFIKLHYMLFAAEIISIICILLIPFIPDVKVKNIVYEPKVVTPDIVISKKSFRLTHSFKEILIIQFSIFFFSSTFFGLIGAYQKYLMAPAWFYGLNNAIPAILAIGMFWIFGKILDQYGPMALIFYGWISYSLVFLGLLSQNLIIIFIVWLWPAYAFRIVTEYIASNQKDKSRAIRDMALASFFTLAGNVLGGIMGGLLTLFSISQAIQFEIVLKVSFFGVTGVGVTYTIIYLVRRLRMSRKNQSQYNT